MKLKDYQPIDYPNKLNLRKVLKKIKNFPPLVSLRSIENLKKKLNLAKKGKIFIFHIGDCAESFKSSNFNYLNKKFKIIKELIKSANFINKPIILILRIAGQFAKPRSRLKEKINGNNIFTYRGDMINSYFPLKKLRIPDPNRLLKSYFISKKIIKYCNSIIKKLKFSDIGVNFFISHEALNLYYEKSLTKKIKNNIYNLSTHYPWIGVKTLYEDSKHVDYIKRIRNPIAIKINSKISNKLILKLINILNYKNESGKLTLIFRLGEKNISKLLPKYIKLLKNKNIIWMIDPMHGNTKYLKNGKKIRFLKDIILEIKKSINLYKLSKIRLSGIHLEMTTENVKECFLDFKEFKEKKRIYKSLMDPRLNLKQTKKIISILKNIDFKSY